MTDSVLDMTARQIEAAYSQTPYPGDEQLVLPNYEDDVIVAALRGRHWSEVSLEVLYRHRWEWFALSPAAFRFYLPISMLAVLYHPDEMGVFTENLVFALTPQFDEHIQNYFDGNFIDYFSSRVGALTPAERGAVCAFIEALAQVCPDAGMVYDVDLQAHTLRFWQGVCGDTAQALASG